MLTEYVTLGTHGPALSVRLSTQIQRRYCSRRSSHSYSLKSPGLAIQLSAQVRLNNTNQYDN